MASKRKSTVPCMIPSKSKHAREEIILGSLPELLPTIPEDSILSISGEDSGHCSHKNECATETQKGGTYSCHPCHFESRDLNYFLDHMHNCHLDFRAQPTFYCLNCGMSVVRFEALALHNANSHPKIMEGLITASLMVNKRDGITTVEQNLFTDNADDKESGIPLIKTPIAKIIKSKGEQKKIVVSHTVEVRKIDTGKDIDPSMLTNVPEIQNGAPSRTGASAMPRTTVSHDITVSNHVFHQHTPSLYSPPCSDSNKDLPKVMIPLSSIPTYDAAMDTSSFLKTSFGKFPYPTKAELCYLTVVSEFPEEQIKLWFTAQRLKQGISWSPEEIDEARRKMFNTVFQGGALQKAPAAPRQVNHIVHHTIHHGSKGPNFPIAKVPYGIMKTRPVGVIAKHANMSTNPNVTRVSYSTSILPPRFPSTVRTSQVLTKNIQATVEIDKSNCVSLELPVSSAALCSSSSSSRSSSCSSSISNGEIVSRRQGNNNSQTNSSASISNNEHCVAEINGKESIKSCSPTGLEEQNGTKNPAITSKTNPTCNNHISGTSNPPEQPHNNIANDESSTNTHKNTNYNVTSEYIRTSCIDAASSLNHASKPPTETTSTTVITMNNSSIPDETKLNKELSMKGMSILQQLIKDEDPVAADSNGPELKMHPLNINFKRIKMNAPENPNENVYPEHKSETAEVPQAFSPPWSNKTPQQLHILRQVFSSTRWPSSQQYEELSVQTGLPKSEVVRWFSDSRYSHKNGQLKWLEAYQRLPADHEAPRGHEDNEPELQKDFLDKKKFAEQDMIKHLEGGGGGLSSAQQMVWQDSYPPLLGLMGSKESNMQGAHEEAAPMGVLQGPWSESTDNHQQPVANQSLIEQQNDTSQARDRLRMELLEV